jgi:hypothetical protein
VNRRDVLSTSIKGQNLFLVPSIYFTPNAREWHSVAILPVTWVTGIARER